MMHRKQAFTLVELLVVITIIGILVSLLMPAVQSARESARRSLCMNNAKQIGLAMIQHEQKHGFFPTGGWGWGYVGDADLGYDYHQCGGWIYNILPYLEQQAQYDLGKGLAPSAKSAAHDQRVQIALTMFNCPTRRRSMAYPYKDYNHGGTGGVGQNYNATNAVSVVGRSDYAANGGNVVVQPGIASDTIWASSCGSNGGCGPQPGPTEATLQAGLQAVAALKPPFNGIVCALSQVKAAQVTDGLSNTYLVGEKYLCPDHYLDGTDGGDNENMYMGDNEDITRWTSVSNSLATVLPPTQDAPGVVDDYSFGSAHPSTFSMCFGDGTIRAISFAIDHTLHTQLGSRNDGQITNMSTLGQ